MRGTAALLLGVGLMAAPVWLHADTSAEKELKSAVARHSWKLAARGFYGL